MGTPPPPDAPPPEAQAEATASVTFAPSPTAAQICGFAFPPSFIPSINIVLPPLPLPKILPFNLGFSLTISCPLTEKTPEEEEFGGGKKSTGNFSAEDRDY